MKRSPLKKIAVLPEQVAAKIAAGEVIDRPEAAVRELLDNAIDSGANEIILELHRGGLEEIRIRDNGSGMTRDDLELCWQRHATSKISNLRDLDVLQTLGFRGEALASLASCARMEVTSALNTSPSSNHHSASDTPPASRNTEPPPPAAHRLYVHGDKLQSLEVHPAPPGTTVSIKNLFYNMPARKQFLKSPHLESGRCRRIFSEKAAAHPRIAFKLFLENKLSIYLPPADLVQRILGLWPRPLPGKQSCLLVENQQEETRLSAVIGRPEVHQKNRRYIHIYVNGRRIEDFSLVQAIQYAYEPWLPGGLFPVAFVFLQLPSRQVDFNIHPAKREVRFRETETIRQWIIASLKDGLAGDSHGDQVGRPTSSDGFVSDSLVGGDLSTSALHAATRNPQGKGSSSRRYPSSAPDQAAGRHSPYAAARNTANEDLRPPSPSEAAAFAEAVTRNLPGGLDRIVPLKGAPAPPEIRYLGQTLGVFLLAECRNTLYIVDQHAAHERLIFDRLRQEPHTRQKLLLPRPLQLEREARMRLETRLERLKSLGIAIETTASPANPEPDSFHPEAGNPIPQASWQLTAIPQNASHLEDEIVLFLETGAGDSFRLEKDLWANLACKAAVKDNHPLDESAARTLLESVFSLENPRCPHGRPLWFSLNRKQLFSLVQRKV